jgi:hypothetical protein
MKSGWDGIAFTVKLFTSNNQEVTIPTIYALDNKTETF